MHFNVDLWGESQTNPHLRAPPHREKAYVKMVNAVLESRCQEGVPCLSDHEVVLLCDGGKPALRKKLLAPWKVRGLPNWHTTNMSPGLSASGVGKALGTWPTVD